MSQNVGSASLLVCAAPLQGIEIPTLAASRSYRGKVRGGISLVSQHVMWCTCLGRISRLQQYRMSTWIKCIGHRPLCYIILLATVEYTVLELITSDERRIIQ